MLFNIYCEVKLRYFFRKNRYNIYVSRIFKNYCRKISDVLFCENRSRNNSENKAWKMEYLISSKKKYVNERASFKIWRLQSTRCSRTRSVSFAGADFAGFHSLLFFPILHKHNSRNFFCAYSFTIYPTKEFVSNFFFSREKFQKLKRFFCLFDFAGFNASAINIPNIFVDLFS